MILSKNAYHLNLYTTTISVYTIYVKFSRGFCYLPILFIVNSFPVGRRIKSKGIEERFEREYIKKEYIKKEYVEKEYIKKTLIQMWPDPQKSDFLGVGS